MPDISLSELAKEDVPRCLRSEFYFDFDQHPFEHSDLLTAAHDVVAVLGQIPIYTKSWLGKQQDGLEEVALDFLTGADWHGSVVHRQFLLKTMKTAAPYEGRCTFAPSVLIGSNSRFEGTGEWPALILSDGVEVLGGTIDMRKGSVWLGEGVVVEPGAHIAGPAIIGSGSTIRAGAYIRGDAIVGRNAVLRGEVKNAVIMDSAELCHPGYCGDSIIGYAGHFGCQAVTANLGLMGGELRLTLTSIEDGPSETTRVALGRRKMGLILGDHSQLGCNTVSDPGTFLGPRTMVYPLTRLAAGMYGPDELVKNRPAEAGVVVRVPLEKRT